MTLLEYAHYCACHSPTHKPSRCGRWQTQFLNGGTQSWQHKIPVFWLPVGLTLCVLGLWPSSRSLARALSLPSWHWHSLPFQRSNWPCDHPGPLSFSCLSVWLSKRPIQSSLVFWPSITVYFLITKHCKRIRNAGNSWGNTHLHPFGSLLPFTDTNRNIPKYIVYKTHAI